MAFTKLEKSVKNIGGLEDVPEIPANQLKELFDKAATDIKDFLNNSLIRELDLTVDENTRARHTHENKVALDLITDAIVQNLVEMPPEFTFASAITLAKLVAGAGIKIEERDGKVVFSSTGGGGSGGGISEEYLAQELSLKADVGNVLTKDNTTPYTPTSDYHPATKGFVEARANELPHKAGEFVEGNFIAFGSSGDLSDSGKNPSDFVGSTEFSNHANNNNIHVSETQKLLWTSKADKTQIVEYASDTAVSISVDSTSKIHKVGVIPSLQLLVPDGSDYSLSPVVYSISFVSGATATTFTAPENFVFSGDGCDEGVFVPEANTSYEMIGMWNFDTLRWVVKAW